MEKQDILKPYHAWHTMTLTLHKFVVLIHRHARLCDGKYDVERSFDADIDIWEHKDWGDNVYFLDWKERKIVGWMKPLPKIGDEIRSKMRSGKIARFEIVKIKVEQDPPDMFFATVKDIGYMQK